MQTAQNVYNKKGKTTPPRNYSIYLYSMYSFKHFSTYLHILNRAKS